MDTHLQKWQKKNFFSRQILARPRLFFSALLVLLLVMLMPQELASTHVTRFIISWDLGVLFYLIACCHMILTSNHDTLHRRAHMQDEGQMIILVLTALSAVVSLTAIVLELASVKEMAASQKYKHIALSAVTILLSWIFIHIMFALHYAHDYYILLARKHTVGLCFPGDEQPDYGDFIYFSFVIGTSGQTADVNFMNRKSRRVGTAHCVLSFFFNTTILALTINIASGLI